MNEMFADVSFFLSFCLHYDMLVNVIVTESAVDYLSRLKRPQTKQSSISIIRCGYPWQNENRFRCAHMHTYVHSRNVHVVRNVSPQDGTISQRKNRRQVTSGSRNNTSELLDRT